MNTFIASDHDTSSSISMPPSSYLEQLISLSTSTSTSTSTSISTSKSASPSTIISQSNREIILKTESFTKEYFQNPKFDSSHDFQHVLRVVNNAVRILREEIELRETKGVTPLDAVVVVLAAFLHDVEDKKYRDVVDDNDDSSSNKHDNGRLSEQLLIRLGLDPANALKVQRIVDGVSYSSEIKAPTAVSDLIREIPELAVVQDADRLDAIGAIGIGRCFTFGGARHARSLDDSIQHFEDKLLKLEGMMKTETGKKLAVERSERIRQFMSWWRDEQEFSCGLS